MKGKATLEPQLKIYKIMADIDCEK